MAGRGGVSDICIVSGKVEKRQNEWTTYRAVEMSWTFPGLVDATDRCLDSCWSFPVGLNLEVVGGRMQLV